MTDVSDPWRTVVVTAVILALIGTGTAISAPETPDGKEFWLAFSYAPLEQSQIAVVAAVDGTTVLITPTAGGTHPPGVAFSVAMNRGDSYQLSSSDDLRVFRSPAMMLRNR
jgi:hypothetical protein